MEINLLAFGKIADITTRGNWKMQGVQSTEALRAQLEQQFPQLRGMSYQVAVNQKIVNSDTPLGDQAEVALLPPFSGG